MTLRLLGVSKHGSLRRAALPDGSLEKGAYDSTPPAAPCEKAPRSEPEWLSELSHRTGTRPRLYWFETHFKYLVSRVYRTARFGSGIRHW